MSALSALHGAFHTLFSNFFVTLPVPQPKGDMSSQIFIVTGANTGLGLELSRHLLQNGIGKLIMGVRNQSKGEAAKRDLVRTTSRPSSAIEIWPLDMESPDSIRAFSTRATSLPRIDGICANAGMMTTTFSLSLAHEKTLTVNVISPFLLFFHLLPKMREHQSLTGKPTSFVIPNSALHYVASTKELTPPTPGIFTRLSDPSKAAMDARYPLSKLLVIWLIRELVAQSPSTTPLPVLNTPNPSFCQSELLREDNSAVARWATKLTARTTEMGSRALYHGLVDAGEPSRGEYLTNCHVQVPAGFVYSESGKAIQRQVFKELLEILEGIEPGVTASWNAPMSEMK